MKATVSLKTKGAPPKKLPRLDLKMSAGKKGSSLGIRLQNHNETLLVV